MIERRLVGARVLRDSGWSDAPVTVAGGHLSDAPARDVDLSGFDLLPGIVDVHGDGFERHMAPRRGALRERDAGMWAVTSELAACGITTAVLAQFWSWEGGMRGPEFAEEVFESVSLVRGTVPVDLRLQLRLETHYLESFDRALEAVDRWGIGYVVFNDHLPHKRLAEGRKPQRLVGQALKSGRNPEAHLALMQGLHAASDQVPAALDGLCGQLAERGVRMGSHDDRTAEGRAEWRGRGVDVSEFPETVEAAQAAREAGDPVVLGAPNVVRGASHAGNVSALELVEAGLCDALASDYHYPSPARAAWRCVELGLLDEAAAWGLVSSGPARVLGLSDRGRIAEGLRADLVVMEPQTRRIVATIAGGQVAWMSGAVAGRFLA
ncbi:alpha-D-ribose 1-methylphosphonate 5-triphosphate diphosphatase [Tropicibacter naphthalenivorans]|uniref:Alpha-D-ribose 1-methylphosphonate 5-triphosphate diphosphatase n=1 Tax=Tropicibacter naphthalenivorans TaxID=441103 RepID=A0A0N7LYH2_9RHOB|nr:alpha-D-ribose 1-methylphosphonate 5-triphosphate diphosphatase [Tropicibacter naphthalenivorans]CUH74857.1 Alpha-D-ribose 1-methylphosphonate 5-triphosphate diphosphatase [Tropicibacter naphthalenivorans]SMC48643.1 alpha-D-ribose 1-methylphosphonate 5-triphosphate diphosphatase [Tropicibacter naphthalenivorans]